LFYLLFIFYSVLFCWLITRIKFFRKSGLSDQTLIFLFIIRIFSLLVGCYFNLYVLPVSDSLTFHHMGIEEFNLLFKNPHEYFINIFNNPYVHGYSRLLEDSNSFWNNLRTNLIAKMLSVIDFFSFKNFWINTLFFNFFVFFGSVALYKVFISIFPKGVFQLIFCIFLLPSALFFSAMIHRDGLILLSLSMIVYHLFFLMRSHQISTKGILIITFFLLLIFLLRNFVFLALIPAIIAWILASKFPKKAFLSFAIVYALTTILFFTSGLVSVKTDLPNYVAQRQESFIKIGKAGSSTLNVEKLKPTLKGFVVNAPQAFNLALMRPYLSKIGNLQFSPFALEIFLMEILFFLLVFFHKRDQLINPVVYFSLFFSLTMLMMAGFTVPIMGAIVRYRSIYFIFLLIPIVSYIDWKKIHNFLKAN
jgi:hypothetical protein